MVPDLGFLLSGTLEFIVLLRLLERLHPIA